MFLDVKTSLRGRKTYETIFISPAGVNDEVPRLKVTTLKSLVIAGFDRILWLLEWTCDGSSGSFVFCWSSVLMPTMLFYAKPRRLACRLGREPKKLLTVAKTYSSMNLQSSPWDSALQVRM